jgi:hypothetical protein
MKRFLMIAALATITAPAQATETMTPGMLAAPGPAFTQHDIDSLRRRASGADQEGAVVRAAATACLEAFDGMPGQARLERLGRLLGWTAPGTDVKATLDHC